MGAALKDTRHILVTVFGVLKTLDLFHGFGGKVSDRVIRVPRSMELASFFRFGGFDGTTIGEPVQIAPAVAAVELTVLGE